MNCTVCNHEIELIEDDYVKDCTNCDSYFYGKNLTFKGVTFSKDRESVYIIISSNNKIIFRNSINSIEIDFDIEVDNNISDKNKYDIIKNIYDNMIFL